MSSPERLAHYLRPDELHTAFNFDFLRCPWSAAALRRSIDDSLAAVAEVGAPATWVLSNHDVVRHVSRLGRPITLAAGHSLADLPPRVTLDRELGRRRSRAAALLMLALPGSAYIYQGDELGLWEVEDLPEDLLRDPTWERSGHRERGRDGCRVPMPWSGAALPFGFSPGTSTAASWLPQPPGFASVTAAAQDDDPGSMLTLYRTALRLRTEHPALGDGELTWLPSGSEMLCFCRDPGFVCMLNLSDASVSLPTGAVLLLASGPLTPAGELPSDIAAWLAVPR